MGQAINILELGLLFALVSMGVYITYKILDFPDLSVDGTFPLGAAICAALLMKGVDPWISIIIAMLGGAVAGAVTAFLHVKLKITNLMSGILVMIGLYSVNLRIMGDKANIPLFGTESVFEGKLPVIEMFGQRIDKLILLLVIVIIVKILLDIYFKTKSGFLLIAVGDNEQVVTSLGISKDLVKTIGLMLSNALVALSGALTTQYQSFADVGMGTGMVVTALAAVIIGVSVFGRMSFIKSTSLAIFGAIIYKAVIAIALNCNLNPNDLKLMTAVLVVIALSANNGAFKNIKKIKLWKGGAKNA